MTAKKNMKALEVYLVQTELSWNHDWKTRIGKEIGKEEDEERSVMIWFVRLKILTRSAVMH